MAVQAGELLHVANSVLIDRIQTGGPGNLNIPTERIYELGNYETVATVRDTPDLSFNMESLDASAEVEALVTGGDFVNDVAGTEYAIDSPLTIDVLSQFKAGENATSPYDVVASVAIPFLALESMSYRFGVQDNASQQATLRGDAVFWSGASAYQQTEAGSGAAGQAIILNNNPIEYNGDQVAGTRYALAVVLENEGVRLVPGTDYTESNDGTGVVTVTITDAVPTTETIRIVYQSAVVANYPQASHPGVSATRPAAVKGRDIEIKVGGQLATDRWSSVQSVQADWRATIEKDEELGTAQAISQDYQTPEVNGSVDIKPRDATELIDRIKEITGVTADEAIGPYQSVPLSLDVILHSPEDGSVLKTLYVPDARFTIPGYSGQVQQKLSVTFPFESDSGSLSVFKGARA